MLAPEFRQRSFGDYCWAKLTVQSRIFGIEINSCKTNVLVPFGDMLNHDYKNISSWNFNDQNKCFEIKAMDDFEKGSEVFYSYGQKCNSRFLLNYGFVIQNNPFNEYSISLPPVPEDDQFIKVKRELSRQNLSLQVFQVSQNVYCDQFQEIYGYSRFFIANDKKSVSQIMEIFMNLKQKYNLQQYDPKKTPMLNSANETQTLEFLMSQFQTDLKGYKTSIENDLKLLSQNDISLNHRNCLTLIVAEKQILNKQIEFIQTILPLIQENFIRIKNLMLNSKYAPYKNYLSQLSELKEREAEQLKFQQANE